jgi:hypothetical protein
MDEKTFQKNLRVLTQEAVPATSDPWSAIQARMPVRNAVPRQRVWPRRTAALVGAIVLLALVAVLVTPGGRAWAQGLLHFFTRAGSDTLPAPTTEPMHWVGLTPGAPAPTITPAGPLLPAFAAECGDTSAPHCSITQIRSLVGFTVKELGTLPAGLYFTGATRGPDSVWLLYASPDNSWGIGLSQEPWTGSPEQTSWEVGASAVVETVRIGDITGEYVKGSFKMMAGDANLVWDPDFPIQNLHWVDEGVLYTMQYVDPTGQLGQAGMIALAESLTTEPVVAALTPMPPVATSPTVGPDLFWTLTAAEAGQLAGFEVWEPATLPEVLFFLGASYDPENQVVQLFFPDTAAWSEGYQNGLTLSEQRIPSEGDCGLCGFVVGDLSAADAAYPHKVVGASATIETVQIGDITGEYVEGVWSTGEYVDGVWLPDSDNEGIHWVALPDLKLLRWQANGMSFELMFLGSSITKSDMIVIAESMR